jgi:hypothetical protein
MSRLLGAVGLTLAALLASWAAQAQPPRGKSALETDPTGWIDLMPGKDLKGWKRVPLAPDEKLNAKNPWSLSADGKTLLCDGVGVKEMFRHEREFGDGIYHVEWRFRKVEGKSGYNGGVYVRSSADGKVWHQAQVAHLEKPPLLGDLFGETLVGGQPKKFEVRGKGHELSREPGEWNTYEITCKGKEISVWVNGATATRWDDCQVPRGHVGLQAEFWFIEFRNLKFRSLDRDGGK